MVVVTYNRRVLLGQCLGALLAQSRRPDLVFVIDNASTDDTEGFLRETGVLAEQRVSYIRLPVNGGGAGGFQRGVDEAVRRGAGWIWLMDDDAMPHVTALAELLTAASSTGDVFGSLAVRDGQLCWPLSAPGVAPEWPIQANDLPAVMETQFLPFLGFLIHRDLVERIGLPDADYFIAADDMEYSLRARREGARTVSIAASRIEHPQADLEWIPFGRRRLSCLRLSPWKRYYDTRNRLLNAKKYFGTRLYTEALPGTLIRMGWVLYRHPDRWAQSRAFIGAIVDGLRGVKGMRHHRWGLVP